MAVTLCDSSADINIDVGIRAIIIVIEVIIDHVVVASKPVGL